MFILSPDLDAELHRRAENRQQRTLAAFTTFSTPAPEFANEPVLEASEIQGNILPGFTMKHQFLIGLRIRSGGVDGARAWLRSLLPKITTMADMLGFRGFRREARPTRNDADQLPVVPLNLAISILGLKLFTTDTDAIQDEAFKSGLYNATTRLGDDPDVSKPGHVSNWRIGSSEETVPHLLLIFASDDFDSLKQVWNELSAPLRDPDSPFEQTIYEEAGNILPGNIEHFGFRDGISQPGVRGRLPWGDLVTARQIDRADPLSEQFAAPGKPLVWPGQFIFGYPTQLPRSPLITGPEKSGGPDWMRNGSFLVFRRLTQNVEAFQTFFRQQAEKFAELPELSSMTPEQRASWLASRVVGRWPSGEPIMRTQSGDPAASLPDFLEINHFAFRDITEPVLVLDGNRQKATISGCPADPFGSICPVFAHIRKVNPRDMDTDKDSGEATRTFQMLRRGIPFGELYEKEPMDERGLLFLAYQTTVQRLLNAVPGQFELLTTDWMNQRDLPQQGGFDLLVGQNQGQPRQAEFNFSQSGTRPIEVDEPWVVPTGGGYFFAPSVSCMKSLFIS